MVWPAKKKSQCTCSFHCGTIWDGRTQRCWHLATLQCAAPGAVHLVQHMRQQEHVHGCCATNQFCFVGLQVVFGNVSAPLRHCQLMSTEASSIADQHQLASVNSNTNSWGSHRMSVGSMVSQLVGWFELQVGLSACCGLSIHLFGFAQVVWHHHDVCDLFAISVAHSLGEQCCLMAHRASHLLWKCQRCQQCFQCQLFDSSVVCQELSLGQQCCLLYTSPSPRD